MAHSRSHGGRWWRIVALAALGLLAGTAWLLLARLGPPSPAVHATARRQATAGASTPGECGAPGAYRRSRVTLWPALRLRKA
jgi:hypothetical protein